MGCSGRVWGSKAIVPLQSSSWSRPGVMRYRCRVNNAMQYRPGGPILKWPEKTDRIAVACRHQGNDPNEHWPWASIIWIARRVNRPSAPYIALPGNEKNWGVPIGALRDFPFLTGLSGQRKRCCVVTGPPGPLVLAHSAPGHGLPKLTSPGDIGCLG